MGSSVADLAGREGVQPPVGCSNSPPPAAPARQRASHRFDTLLKLYRGFVQESRWVCLTLKTCDREEQLIFSCNCGQATAAGAAYSSVAPTDCRRARKWPPNERRREKERKRQKEREEQGYFQFSSSSTSSVRTFISFSREGNFCSPSSSYPNSSSRLCGSLLCSSLHCSSYLCSSHPCSRRSHCSSHPCGSHFQCSCPIAAAIPGAASPNAAATTAAATLAAATIASAVPALAATEALRECTKMAA
jgi:hypothetical protein